MGSDAQAMLDRAGVPSKYRHAPPRPKQESFTIYKTPWEIALDIAHKRIHYGTIIEEMHGGYLLRRIKENVFRTARDAITDATTPEPPR